MDNQYTLWFKQCRACNTDIHKKPSVEPSRVQTRLITTVGFFLFFLQAKQKKSVVWNKPTYYASTEWGMQRRQTSTSVERECVCEQPNYRRIYPAGKKEEVNRRMLQLNVACNRETQAATRDRGAGGTEKPAQQVRTCIGHKHNSCIILSMNRLSAVVCSCYRRMK